MNYLVLKFIGKPISKDNHKIISKYPSKKSGRHYYFLLQKYKDYEKDLKEQAIKQLPPGFKPFEEDVWMSLFFHFKSKRHTDVTNLPKSICDAMQKVLYDNDKRVWLDLVYPNYSKEVEEGFTMVIRPVKAGPATNKEKIDFLNLKRREIDAL